MADPNVTVINEGTIWLFDLDPAAREWVDENVGGEQTWFGRRLVVEHRYVDDLVAGMQDAGLEVSE